MYEVSLPNIEDKKEVTAEVTNEIKEEEIQAQADNSQEQTEKQEEVNIVVITITDGSETVNIRSQPTTKSEILGKAKDGESFELVSEKPRWYEIKFNNETNAYVSTRYAQILKDLPSEEENL